MLLTVVGKILADVSFFYGILIAQGYIPNLH